MKNKTLLAAVIVFAASAIYGVLWCVDTHRELKKLREENKEFVESTKPSGGQEVPPEAPKPGYAFPIHSDDYYMLTSPYGLRISPILKVLMMHQGVDIAAVWRAQVIPIADGEVIEHWPPPGAHNGLYKGHPTKGGYIVIRHDDGMETDYSHLSATYVREGQRVKKGQVIGRIGDTGLATGMHLHFGMKRDGKYVNPLLYLEVPRETEN